VAASGARVILTKIAGIKSLGLIGALLFLGTGWRTDAGGPSGIEVTLAAVHQVFRSPDEVRLRLVLDNSFPDCVGLFLDPVFSPIESDRRPLSLVRLKVTDEAGRDVLPTSKVEGQLRRMRLHELVLLECGTSYGRELPLAHIPWSYHLAPGRYHVRAEVKISVGTYIRARGLVSQLQQLWGFSKEMINGMLRDAVAQSNEVPFEISGP
jgi:hypothetical protein